MFTDCLKKHKISITFLSNVLDVSRPTVYKLIEKYDNHDPLPDERYQIIFDMICSFESENTNELLKQLKSYKSLIEREKTIGSSDLSVERADLLTDIIELSNTDLHSLDCDENIYKYINVLISSYKEDPTLKMYAKYVLILYGVIDVKKFSDKDKPFFSNIYRVNHKYKKDELEVDPVYLEKLTHRLKELAKEREDFLRKKQKDLFEEVKNTISMKIKEDIIKKTEAGVRIENIDYDEIINNILSKN